ncbi:hypothetical protein D9M69_372480 [compost metagenome]
MPSTPFIGVRISWLILARNSALAFSSAELAASAWRLLKRSLRMVCWRSLRAMLRMKPLTALSDRSRNASQSDGIGQ